MSKKNYFEDISAKFASVAKYSRVFRLLLIVAYLIYLETLIVSVFAAVDYVPSTEEVRGRFTPIKTKNETINSIESYFYAKESNLTRNLQKEIRNNPFMPYLQDNLTPTPSPTPTENLTPAESTTVIP